MRRSLPRGWEATNNMWPFAPSAHRCRKSSSGRAIPGVEGANSESEKEKLNRDDDELLMHTEDR